MGFGSSPVRVFGAVGACIVLLLSGCLGAGPNGDPNDPNKRILGGPGSGSDFYPRGVHPYPNGDEWPAGLEGPFEKLPIEGVRVVSGDIELDGWIHRPNVPEGVKVPIVLWSSPYFGQTQGAGDSEEIGTDPVVPVNLLVSKGYAVALFNVRGTGNSGGCFEFFGPNEQADQARLVEYLGNQKWGNGRVGMMGLSYHGTTPWEAAINNPPALKTIVVAGLVSDLYTFFHTPQGAPFTIGPAFNALVAGLVSLAPPAMSTNGTGSGFRHFPVIPGRACPELVQTFADMQADQASDMRPADYWKGRQLIAKFPGITSSVFLTHGFQDNHGSGHQQQEDWVWDSLTAPKRMLEGQWGHEFPNTNSFNSEWVMAEWTDMAVEWLDFWLKGIGPAPPFIGVVDYQDGLGQWHTSKRWPPLESHQEVLYLAGSEITGVPSDAPQTFRSVPLPNGPGDVLCPNARSSLEPLPSGFVFTSGPATTPIHIAGNPFAYLNLETDLPGGYVGTHVYDLGPDFGCGPDGPQDARLWVAGVADLRFHDGGYEGEDFPVGTPTKVRVDISSLSEVLEPGHRLGVVVSFGDPTDRAGQPYYPTVTLQGGAEASHLVLPIESGTLGGLAPTLAYPPRPFLPEGVSVN